MGLVFDDVVGIVEVINCRDVKVQVCMFVLITLFSLYMYLYNRVSTVLVKC